MPKRSISTELQASDQRQLETLATRQARFRSSGDVEKMKDRAKFLPLLVEANVGLARAMLTKRLVSEAQQVVAYLKTSAR